MKRCVSKACRAGIKWSVVLLRTVLARLPWQKFARSLHAIAKTLEKFVGAVQLVLSLVQGREGGTWKLATYKVPHRIAQGVLVQSGSRNSNEWSRASILVYIERRKGKENGVCSRRCFSTLWCALFII